MYIFARRYRSSKLCRVMGVNSAQPTGCAEKSATDSPLAFSQQQDVQNTTHQAPSDER